jgi:hypothetical protein
MNKSFLDDISYLYNHIAVQDSQILNEESDYYNQEFTELVENIIATISYSMISEGFSASGVIDFLANAQQQEILEYYLNCDFIGGLVSEEYIEEQLTILEGGWSLLGKAALAGLKNIGRVSSVAAKRMAGPGARKAVTNAVTRVQDLAKGAKAALPTVAKGVGVFGLGATGGYVGSKMAGAGSESPTAKTTPSEAPSGGSEPPSASTPPLSPSNNGGSGNGNGGKSTEPTKTKKSDDGPAGETPMQKWARLYPKLASKVKPGQSGYDEISQMKDNPGSNDKKDQTPTTGPSGAKIDTKAADAALAAENERLKKASPKQTTATKTESYDAYDLVLDYLFETGQVDTISEAHYVMLEMDSDVIGSIVEAKTPKKWIQGAIKNPGALSKKLGVPEDENIPATKLAAAAKKPGKTGRQARLAMTLKNLKK